MVQNILLQVKLNIAGIGVGGMGSHNLAQCAKSEQVTALCDVDHKYGSCHEALS